MDSLEEQGRAGAEDEASMTSHRNRHGDPTAKARAEARFRHKELQKREGQSATDDYQAGQEADRANMAKLRELRLAAKAKAPEAKRKPAAKAKR
jgi:hypothetical protein